MEGCFHCLAVENGEERGAARPSEPSLCISPRPLYQIVDASRTIDWSLRHLKGICRGARDTFSGEIRGACVPPRKSTVKLMPYQFGQRVVVTVRAFSWLVAFFLRP